MRTDRPFVFSKEYEERMPKVPCAFSPPAY